MTEYCHGCFKSESARVPLVYAYDPKRRTSEFYCEPCALGRDLIMAAPAQAPVAERPDPLIQLLLDRIVALEERVNRLDGRYAR